MSSAGPIDRPYGTNPYVGYDDPNGQLLFELPDAPDKRLPVKERVVGIASGTDHVTIVRRALVGGTPLEVVVGHRQLVVWHKPGQSSAVDADTVAGGAEVGTIGVFLRVVDGRRLRLERGDDGGFRDSETGSQWDVLGNSVAGLLKGKRLTPYQHLDTFWFAWATFHPDTDLVR